MISNIRMTRSGNCYDLMSEVLKNLLLTPSTCHWKIICLTVSLDCPHSQQRGSFMKVLTFFKCCLKRPRPGKSENWYSNLRDNPFLMKGGVQIVPGLVGWRGQTCLPHVLISLQNAYQETHLSFLVDLLYSLRALCYLCQSWGAVPFDFIKKNSLTLRVLPLSTQVVSKMRFLTNR